MCESYIAPVGIPFQTLGHVQTEVVSVRLERQFGKFVWYLCCYELFYEFLSDTKTTILTWHNDRVDQESHYLLPTTIWSSGDLFWRRFDLTTDQWTGKPFRTAFWFGTKKLGL